MQSISTTRAARHSFYSTKRSTIKSKAVRFVCKTIHRQESMSPNNPASVTAAFTEGQQFRGAELFKSQRLTDSPKEPTSRHTFFDAVDAPRAKLESDIAYGPIVP